MAKSNKIKRKVPIFRVPMTLNVNYTELFHTPEVEKAIIDEVLCAIKEGVTNEKDSTSLFVVAQSDYLIALEKPQWTSSLQNALKYYVAKEDYSKCVECRDLINKLSYEQQPEAY
jgi:hypothetical protein